MGQIGVLAFAENVEFPTDPCYSRGLSLATPANKEKLETEFISVIQPSSVTGANFSNAFTEAFRLLANGVYNASEQRNNQRSIYFCFMYTVSQKTTLMLHTIDSTNINRFR